MEQREMEKFISFHRQKSKEKTTKRWTNRETHLWGCSSVGRAPALQAGGHGFESHHLHQSYESMTSRDQRDNEAKELNGLIAQVVRARA